MAKGKSGRKSNIPLDKTGSGGSKDKGGNVGKNTNVKRIPRHQGR